MTDGGGADPIPAMNHRVRMRARCVNAVAMFGDRLPVRETCYTFFHHLQLRRLQHGGIQTVWQ